MGVVHQVSGSNFKQMNFKHKNFASISGLCLLVHLVHGSSKGPTPETLMKEQAALMEQQLQLMQNLEKLQEAGNGKTISSSFKGQQMNAKSGKVPKLDGVVSQLKLDSGTDDLSPAASIPAEIPVNSNWPGKNRNYKNRVKMADFQADYQLDRQIQPVNADDGNLVFNVPLNKENIQSFEFSLKDLMNAGGNQ